MTVLQYQFNDGGKYVAGYTGKRVTGDCVTRAIAIATGLPYETVRTELMELQHRWCTTSNSRAAKACRKRQTKSVMRGVWKEVYKPYLKQLGFTYKSLCTVGSSKRYHLVVDDLPTGTLIVKTRRHLSCVINHVLHDAYDSRFKNQWVNGEPTTNMIPATVWSYWIKD
tara:strand:+ start:580 stop:1083 length:504 start_codon:yes stop_codon:yes gene_type:complete